MFELCLFDLDNTLVRTDDLRELRERCRDRNDASLLAQLRKALPKAFRRRIYKEPDLQKIKSKFEGLRLGVFTRSPRSYANEVLSWAYPGVEWDVVVAFEDVEQTKPYGEGIVHAMDQLGITHTDRVMMVGDSDVDVCAAYHAGCWVTLDQTGWPKERLNEHWRALDRLPDAVIRSTPELLEVLAEPQSFLPEFERLLAGGADPQLGHRFQKINHFLPKTPTKPNKPYPIFVAGRSFSGWSSVKNRKDWHKLTKSIAEHKDADDFPKEWIRTIRRFIATQFRATLFGPQKITVTVIPHKPDRTPRLEHLLRQFGESVEKNPIRGCVVSVAPSLFSYKEGVRSHHRDHLDSVERFENVRDHLVVRRPKAVDSSQHFIIVDDVCTTGASLIYATRYLRDAGAKLVTSLALAKNITKVVLE